MAAETEPTVDISADFLKQLKEAAYTSTENQETVRQDLRGRQLMVSGWSDFKIWLHENDQPASADREIQQFADAPVQILDVFFVPVLGQDHQRFPRVDWHFAILLESPPPHDQPNMLPRVMFDDQIEGLRDPFPPIVEDESLAKIVAAAGNVARRFLQVPSDFPA